MTPSEANQWIIKLTAVSCRRLASRLSPVEVERMKLEPRTDAECEVIKGKLIEFAENLEKMVKPPTPPQPVQTHGSNVAP